MSHLGWNIALVERAGACKSQESAFSWLDRSVASREPVNMLRADIRRFFTHAHMERVTDTRHRMYADRPDALPHALPVSLPEAAVMPSTSATEARREL